MASPQPPKTIFVPYDVLESAEVVVTQTPSTLLPGHRVLTAGANVTLDTSAEGALAIAATSTPGPAGPAGPEGPQGIQGISAGRNFYLAVTDDSDISGYKTLLEAPSAAAEQTITVACTGVNVDFLVDEFVTNPGVPGAVDYPAGTSFRRFYTHLNSGTARLHLQVFKRTAAGVETIARDEFSPTFLNQTVALVEWLASSPSAGALAIDDRLVVKLYAQRVTGGGGTVQVTVHFEGTSATSHIQTTISTGLTAHHTTHETGGADEVLFPTGLLERGRTTAMGEWTNVLFNASNFTGGGSMVWTVTAGNVIFNRYMLIGRTLTWQFRVDSSVFSGPPSNQIFVSLPFGATLVGGSVAIGWMGSAAGWKTVMCFTTVGGSSIQIFNIDFSPFSIGPEVYLAFTVIVNF